MKPPHSSTIHAGEDPCMGSAGFFIREDFASEGRCRVFTILKGCVYMLGCQLFLLFWGPEYETAPYALNLKFGGYSKTFIPKSQIVVSILFSIFPLSKYNPYIALIQKGTGIFANCPKPLTLNPKRFGSSEGRWAILVQKPPEHG